MKDELKVTKIDDCGIQDREARRADAKEQTCYNEEGQKGPQ